MPEDKTQEKTARKFVEASAEMELSEPIRLVGNDELLRTASDSSDARALKLSQSENTVGFAQAADSEQSEEVENDQDSSRDIHSPLTFIKQNVVNTALFLIFPLACTLTALLVDPRLMGNSYCRTAIFCAFIWNVIGGVIYAQSRKALERRVLFLIFAMPFAASGIICSVFFPILLVLMQYLPPGLK